MDVAKAYWRQGRRLYACRLKLNKNEGIRRTSYWGGLFLGYFFLATQKEVTRYQAKSILKSKLEKKTTMHY